MKDSDEPSRGHAQIIHDWNSNCVKNQYVAPYPKPNVSSAISSVYSSLFIRRTTCMCCGEYIGDGVFSDAYDAVEAYMNELAFCKYVKNEEIRKKLKPYREKIIGVWCCGCGNFVHICHLNDFRYEWIDSYYLEWGCHSCLYSPKRRKIEMTINPVDGHFLTPAAKYVLYVYLIHIIHIITKIQESIKWKSII